jgi:hypothetical protein
LCLILFVTFSIFFVFCFFFIVCFIFVVVFFCYFVFAFFMPRFVVPVCVLCTDVMCWRALYVCACVVHITAECGYVLWVCVFCFLFIVCFIFVVVFFCYFVFAFFMPRFVVPVCVLCTDVMCWRALYVCACVVHITAECGYVVSLCFLFFFYCLFYFCCSIFLLFCFCIFYAKICGTCMCVVHGRYVLARVVCVRLCSAHNSRVRLCVVSLCFLFFIYCLFYFCCSIFLLFCFCIFYAKICGTCMCVVHGRYVLARVVCVRLCSAHNSRVRLCCEFVFFVFFLLFVLFLW